MTSQYVVVKFGDLNRDETMNIAVLAWELGSPESPVLMQLLKNWRRVDLAFNRPAVFKDGVLCRLSQIKTVAELDRAFEKMTPYTPFEFTEKRGSLTSAEVTLKYAADHFLNET